MIILHWKQGISCNKYLFYTDVTKPYKEVFHYQIKNGNSYCLQKNLNFCFNTIIKETTKTRGWRGWGYLTVSQYCFNHQI